MIHPIPGDAKVVRACDLKVGMLAYSEAGWLGGLEEYDGCWRKITAIEPDLDSERDLSVTLEKFDSEPHELVHWYDNHTLVIVHIITKV